MKRTTTIETAAPSKRQRTSKTTVTRTIKPAKYKSKKSGQVLYARRSVQQHIDWDASVGFVSLAGNSRDMNLSFSLGGLQVYLAGVSAFTPAMPQVSEFTNLYDEYRIRSVDIEIYFSQNTTNTTTSTIPLIHLANDWNSLGSFSLTDMEQYPAKTYSCAAIGVNYPIRWKVRPACRLDALTTGGLLSTSALDANGWMDTAASNVRFLGTRIYGDTPTSAPPAGIVGSFTIKCTYNMEFRRMR